MSDFTNAFPPRLPPVNLQAEQALLGALLANNRAFTRVEEFLRPEHFADPIHALIFETMARRIGAGQLADAVTMKAELENSNLLAEVGGTTYLAQLLSAMVGIINAGEYGRAIHDTWLRRQLIDLGEEVTNEAYGSEEGKDAASVLEGAEEKIYRLSSAGANMKPNVNAGAAVRGAISRARAAVKRGTALAGVSSGYNAIDRLLGGLQDESLLLIGARPSMGKSALALGVAARAAALGAQTYMWSGEMGADQLGARLAAAHAGLNTMAVFTGHYWKPPEECDEREVPRALTYADWARLEEAATAAESLPLEFDCRPGLTVSAIRSRARHLKQTKGLKLIVLDYIQLMRGSRAVRGRGLYETMTEISHDLMEMKAELGVPVIALSQLSRGLEGREDKLPQLSDLRDSGALEQDATAVAFVHRPHYYLSRAVPMKRPTESDSDFSQRQSEWFIRVQESRGKAVLAVAKQRNGPTGMVDLQWDDNTTWFRSEKEAPASLAWGVS